MFSWRHHRVPPVKYRLLEVPGGRGIFSTARFSTSARAPISTVISLHCVSLDSIRPCLSVKKKKLDAEENSGKHRCVFLFSRRPLLFPRRLPLAPPSPAGSPLSVGVNLSPRLSPNTELYKLKPISLPALGSSYSGHFIFVYLLSANMPGLLRSSQATGGGDILLTRLVTRWRVKDSFCVCECTYMSPFRVYAGRAAHNLRPCSLPHKTRPLHVRQNVRIFTCGRLRRYSSVCAFHACMYKVS